MLRKMFSLFLCAVLLASSVASAAAAKVDVGTELSTIERDIYGVEQKGSVMERINELERDLIGQHYSGGLAMRLNNLHKLVYESTERPSLLAQMNAIEWGISKEVSTKPLTERIDAAELELSGNTNDGTIRERVSELAGVAFGSVTIPMEEVAVPQNTLINIALTKSINAKNEVVGDTIPFRVSEDVMVGDVLVFAAGAQGVGTVTKVKQAKNFGRNAELEINFEKVKSVDGKFVKTYVGEEAKAEMKHLAYATGASVAGMLVLGPVGIVAGALVHGKNIELPEGSQAVIQTSVGEKIWGVNTKYEPIVEATNIGDDSHEEETAEDYDGEGDNNSVDLTELY